MTMCSTVLCVYSIYSGILELFIRVHSHARMLFSEETRAQLEKIRGMSEEERREYFRRNPKEVINKAAKGKMRFLQKYFHRGVYYLVWKTLLLRTRVFNMYKKFVYPTEHILLLINTYGYMYCTVFTNILVRSGVLT